MLGAGLADDATYLGGAGKAHAAHGGVGELLAQLQPSGAVAPFDADALAATATGLLRAPPSPPATVPFTLQAMQQQTLDLYAELAG